MACGGRYSPHVGAVAIVQVGDDGGENGARGGGGGSGLRGGWTRVEFDCPSDTICRVVDFGVLMNEREASKMTPAFEAQTAGSMKV